MSPDVSDLRVKKSIIAWLIVRGRWLNYTTSRNRDNRGAIPQTQAWKDFLVFVCRTLGLERSSATAVPAPAAVAQPVAAVAGQPRNAPSASKRRRVEKRAAAADFANLFQFTVSSVLVDVVYDGQLVKTPNALRACKYL